MNFLDAQGQPIILGKKVKMTINSGQVIEGKVILISQKQTTIRSNVTDKNPDGIIFGTPHNMVNL